MRCLSHHGYVCIEGGKVPASMVGLICEGFSIRWFPHDDDTNSCRYGRGETLSQAILDLLHNDKAIGNHDHLPQEPKESSRSKGNDAI